MQYDRNAFFKEPSLINSAFMVDGDNCT
jgi:hypothetical protein